MLIIFMDERDVFNRFDMGYMLIKRMQHGSLNRIHHRNLPLPVVTTESHTQKLSLSALYPLLAIELDSRNGFKGLYTISDLLKAILLEDVNTSEGVEVEDVDVCGFATCCY